MRDAVLTIGLVLSFATLVAAHVATLFGLFRRAPAVQALAALVLPPLAPVLALRKDMVPRALLWIGSAVAYATTFALSR